jgi:hypothetical protein
MRENTPADGLVRPVRLALVATVALVGASWWVIALAHIDDDYGFDQVSGAWLALVRYANHGVVYPPLYNGVAFGGTRYMPLQFVLDAGLVHVLGSYIVADRLIAYASAIVMSGLLFVVCRRLAGSALLAAALVVAVLSTSVGLGDSTGIRADTLPVAFQLAALYVVTRQSSAPSRRATVVAAALCALAFFTKLTAVWAPVALVAWLWTRNRRRLALFVATLALSVAGLFGLFEAVSDGRMGDNLRALAFAGTRLPAIDTVTKFISMAEQSANALWVLVPFALAALAFGVARRRLSVYQVSLLVSFVILVLVLQDIGADENHLIDVEVLTAIVCAEAVALLSRESARIVVTIGAAALVWGTLTSYYVNVRHDVAAAARELAGGASPYSSAPPLPETVKRSDVVLSDDAYVSVSRGEDPVVLDPFMLVRIDREHPDWAAQLVDRITHHRFAEVVTRSEISTNPESRWWTLYNFGAPVTAAILRSYRLVPVKDDQRTGSQYWVYVPKR